VADAFFRAAESDVRNEIFNVGSGNTYAVNYLVSLLGGEVVHIPKRPGEPESTFADTGKISRVLNWHPKVSFEEGVKRMLEKIEDWRQAPVWDTASIAEATKEWFAYLGTKN
jgi:UDP-glucose 4-epimerase